MADSNISDAMKECYENLIVIDAGANLTNKKYSRDLDSVVQRAKDAGQLCVPMYWKWNCIMKCSPAGQKWSESAYYTLWASHVTNLIS